jgi:hypothetical protein
VLVALGTSLIAFGALLALIAVLLPRPDDERLGRVESARCRRNIEVTAVSSAVVALVGAALAVSASWPWSFLAIAVAALGYYAALVIATYRSNRWLLWEVRTAREIDKRPDGTPGRIWAATAASLGYAPPDLVDSGLAFYGDLDGEEWLELAEGAQRIAGKKSRFSRALAYPMGHGHPPFEILLRHYYLGRARRAVRRDRARAAREGQVD